LMLILDFTLFPSTAVAAILHPRIGSNLIPDKTPLWYSIFCQNSKQYFLSLISFQNIHFKD
jgi:hypothetical protein